MGSKPFLPFLAFLLLSAATDDQWTTRTVAPAENVHARENNDFLLTRVRAFRSRRSLDALDRTPALNGIVLQPLPTDLLSCPIHIEASSPKLRWGNSLYRLMSLQR